MGAPLRASEVLKAARYRPLSIVRTGLAGGARVIRAAGPPPEKETPDFRTVGSWISRPQHSERCAAGLAVAFLWRRPSDQQG